MGHWCIKVVFRATETEARALCDEILGRYPSEFAEITGVANASPVVLFNPPPPKLCTKEDHVMIPGRCECGVVRLPAPSAKSLGGLTWSSKDYLALVGESIALRERAYAAEQRTMQLYQAKLDLESKNRALYAELRDAKMSVGRAHDQLRELQIRELQINPMHGTESKP